MGDIELQNYDVIAYAITPWQLRGIEAALDYVHSLKKVRFGCLVIMAEHYITGRCIHNNELNINNDFYDVDIVYVDKWNFSNDGIKITEEVSKLVGALNDKASNPIYVLNAGKIDLRWINYIKKSINRNIVYILIDDGTGSYNGYKGLDCSKYKALKNHLYNCCIKFMERRKTIIDFRLLCFSEGQLVENTWVAQFYRNALLRSTAVGQDIKNYFTDRVVVNSQCFFDNKEIMDDEDIETFGLFADLLPQNIEVTLKPHPREKTLDRYAQFNWKIIPNISYTQEEIFAGLQANPKMVVGITSSTLINLHALFGVKTISLAKIFLKKNLPKGVRKDTNDFIKMYEKIVEMPKDEIELKKIIEEILDRS